MKIYIVQDARSAVYGAYTAARDADKRLAEVQKNIAPDAFVWDQDVQTPEDLERKNRRIAALEQLIGDATQAIMDLGVSTREFEPGDFEDVVRFSTKVFEATRDKCVMILTSERMAYHERFRAEDDAAEVAFLDDIKNPD